MIKSDPTAQLKNHYYKFTIVNRVRVGDGFKLQIFCALAQKKLQIAALTCAHAVWKTVRCFPIKQLGHSKHGLTDFHVKTIYFFVVLMYG